MQAWKEPRARTWLAAAALAALLLALGVAGARLLRPGGARARPAQPAPAEAPRVGAPAPAAGQVAPAERVAEAGARLRITGAGGGPLAGARVELAAPDGALSAAAPGADGVVALPRPGRFGVRAACAGHVARAAVVRAEGTVDFTLERAGELELRFGGRDGAGVAGVAVELVREPGARAPRASLAPLANGLFEPGLGDALRARRLAQLPEGELAVAEDPAGGRAASDAGGVVLWGDLAPGAYRYRLAGPTSASPAPPHETPALAWRERAGRAVPGTPDPTAPRDLSGLIAVRAGERTAIAVLVPAPALVAGRIADEGGRPAPGAEVRLDGREVYRHPLAPAPAWVDFTERRARADAAGFFELAELRAGPKQLVATFERDEDGLRHCFFVTAQLELAEGQALDLGTLAPLGARTEVEVVCALPGGEVLALEDVYGAGGAPESLSLTVRSVFPGNDLRGYGTYLHFLLFARLELDPRRPCVLHGLGWSSYELTLDLGDLPAPPLPYALARTALFSAPLRADLVEIELACPLPAGGFGRAAPRGVLVPERPGAEPAWEDLDFELGPGAAVARARVAPGAYRALVVQAELRPSEPRPGAEPPGGGWCGERALDVGQAAGQRFELELRPGVRVAGVQVDAEGRPVAQRIAFTPPELARLGARGLWLYADFPRPDGSFSIGGVPPGAELVDDRGGGTHAVPGEGLSGIVIRQQP